ncbi:MAG: transcription-repair coupling factor, partial [Proteobacteria bacterium]|nr:transcription-repair coupling factor [Pseudomonadota bacterium]
CGTVFDYLPDHAAFITIGDHYQAASQFWSEITSRHSEYGVDVRRPLLPPPEVFIPTESLYEDLGRHAVLELRTEHDAPVHQKTGLLSPPDLHELSQGATALERLATFIEAHDGPVLLCAESPGRREVLLEGLNELGLHPAPASEWPDFIAQAIPLGITVAPVDRGFYQGPKKPTLIVENQIFGARVAQRRRRQSVEETNADAIVRDLTELRPGVPVVHLQHGVGRY